MILQFGATHLQPSLGLTDTTFPAMPMPQEWTLAIAAWRAEPSRPSGKMNLAQLAREANSLSAALQSRMHSLIEAQGPISCGIGCNACCRHVVPLSPPEAFLLSETHAGLSWERRAETEERLDRVHAALDRAEMGSTPIFDSAAKYFSLGMPCPYLEAEACVIHPDRPMACREHLALSPAAWCWDFPDAFIRVLDLPVSVGEALATVAAELMGCREAIPMVRLQPWLAANGAWAEREWDAVPLLDRLAALCMPSA